MAISQIPLLYGLPIGYIFRKITKKKCGYLPDGYFETQKTQKDTKISKNNDK